LDIETLGVLEEFLLGYDGCAIIVSHDRFFMDKVVDHLFIFEGQGVVRDFPGNYSDYRDWVDLEEDRKIMEAKEVVKPIENKKVAEVVTKADNIEKRKLTFKEKFEFETLEKEIEKLNAEKILLEEEVATLSTEFDRIAELSSRLLKIQDELDTKELRWLELSEFI